MVEAITIAIHFANDTVGIMQYVVDDGHTIRHRTVTSEDIDREIARSAFGPELLPVRGWNILADREAALPEQRDFRDAWTWRDGKVVHDMGRAREIHRSRLRAHRVPLLQQLDVDYMRAHESGNAEEMKSVSEHKQRLRDVTRDSEIDKAETVDQLRAHRPF